MPSKLFRKKTIEHILRHANAGNEGHSLKRDLTTRDLTSFGIAAIIGAGIFSTIGSAAAFGGPAVTLMFLLTAVACGFSALCYAEFASAIPISGSAYTYAYVSFGELVAWIIGWDLIMEYAVGNIAVAISWSDYFTSLLHGLGIPFPDYLSMDYRTAYTAFVDIGAALAKHIPLNHFSDAAQQAYNAWLTAPRIGSIPIVVDVPAFAIVFAITWLVYVGIRESKMASNIMVLLKIGVLLLVIGIGAFYVNPGNWHPFAPNGLAGMLKGISGIFFAYIGFDAISTTAEECRNPQKDLPKAMMLSLVVTTVIYVLVSLVLTGMVHYSKLGVGDPLSYVFQVLHLNWLSGIIAFSAIVAMAGVLLVFQIGQPRIWMSMSRDGLLPPKFATIHPTYRTPAFATIVTGIIVAVPTLFVNLNEVIDLTSIGTLFAFILVSGGVLLLSNNDLNKNNAYKIPFLSSRVYMLPIIALAIGFSVWFNASGVIDFWGNWGTWQTCIQKIPMLAFMLECAILTWFCLARNLSLIPVLSLLANSYLITQLGITNWMRFAVWLTIGLILYFLYGQKRSKLRN